MKKGILFFALCLLSSLVYSDPIFKYNALTIELTKVLSTDGNNSTSILINNSNITVTDYRFEFSSSSLFPEYLTTLSPSGWYAEVAAGVEAPYLFSSIPNLEVGQQYWVRVSYKSNGTWSTPSSTESFSTTLSILAFNYADLSSIDLYTAGLAANDGNSFYTNYRIEFSTAITFPEYATTSSPAGWYGETNSPNAPFLGSVSNLEVDQMYFVRVRVKTLTMTSWSDPGPITSFNTVNTRSFFYPDQSNIDIYTAGISANDYNNSYSNYRIEFSTSFGFPEYNSTPLPAGMYLETNSPNSPYLGYLSGLTVDQTYYARVKVKTGTMNGWSDPGPITSFNTINTRTFYHCENTNLDIKHQALLASDLSSFYYNYKYEFCTDPSFSNNPPDIILSYDIPFTSQTAPYIHTALPALAYNTVYYSRIRVKRDASSGWSNPGPVCSFTTAPCVPEPGYCPSYRGSCTYVPINYYSFDNDCQPEVDCIGSLSSGPTSFRSIQVFDQGKVGTSFKTKLKPNEPNSKYEFQTDYPSGSNGDFTIEFGFKLDADDNFILTGALRSNTQYSFPFFQLNSISLRVILSESPAWEINQNLNAVGLLSSGYYFDNNWHHVAMKFNQSLNLFELFIDGNSPVEFKIQLSPGDILLPPNANSYYSLFIPTAVDYNHLDELAFYDKPLPDNIIYQHYLAFNSATHYEACDLDNNITPPATTTVLSSGIYTYDPLEYTPGYDTDVLTPGKALSYYHSDLVSLPTTADQIETFPTPRFLPGHGLQPNINWTDTKYLGFSYSGSGTALTPVFDANNDVRIQLELCKNWNYMYTLSEYGSDSQNSIVNTGINSNSQYKLALISNIVRWNNTYGSAGGSSYISDIRTNDLNLTPPGFTFPSSCLITHTVNPGTFPDPRDVDYYKLLGRMSFKNVVSTYIESPILNNLTPLNHKIDFVSDNSFENRLTDYDEDPCLFASQQDLIDEKNNLSVPNNPLFPNSNSPSWNDYMGFIVGRNYKTYADAIINDNSSSIYNNLQSNDIFNSGTKFLFYLNTAIYGTNSPYFENYNMKRVCNTPYLNNSSTNYYSTPNFYPWGGPFGWYASGGPQWGLSSIGERVTNEIPLGDQMYAPFVSARWSRDVNGMRPGQYLGFLKALSMYGVDFFHAGYFNVTDYSNLWGVKKYPGDAIGFANDPRTWVWQLATTSYAQATSSRYESLIRDCDILASGKYGNEFYIVNKKRNENKYLVFGTIQTLTNIQGSEVLSKNISLTSFNSVINNFKINVRRQGSVYMLDMTGSQPVFYQLDKWHEYTHPSYWTKDFNFEAEVDDFGNSLNLVTELPQNAAPGDYTNFTTGVKLTSASNNTKYQFIPRNTQSLDNDYQVWLRMKLINGTQGRIEIKLNGSNTFIVDNITDTDWQWYGYESCGGTRMIINDLNSVANDLILTSNSDNLLIDQVCLKTDLGLNLQTPLPSACPSCCTFNNRALTNTAQTDTALKNSEQARQADNFKFSIHPNPTSNNCILYSKAITPEKSFTVRIYNNLGVEIKTAGISNSFNTAEVDLSQLVNGVYTIVLEDKTSLQKDTKMVIVEH